MRFARIRRGNVNREQACLFGRARVASEAVDRTDRLPPGLTSTDNPLRFITHLGCYRAGNDKRHHTIRVKVGWRTRPRRVHNFQITIQDSTDPVAEVLEGDLLPHTVTMVEFYAAPSLPGLAERQDGFR